MQKRSDVHDTDERLMLWIGMGAAGRGIAWRVHLPSLQISEVGRSAEARTAAQKAFDGHDTAFPVTPRRVFQRVPSHTIAPYALTATQRLAVGQLTETVVMSGGPIEGACWRCQALPFQRSTSDPWCKGGSA